LLLQNRITVTNQISDGLPTLWVEREKFQRLFDLLLRDEIISLPAGSHIILSAQVRFEPEQEVDIEIRDNGPGLPKEALRTIFDPFFLRTENYDEFGINLMACYFITYHHGGKIEVKNQPGEGVTFTLTFPLKPKRMSPAQDEEAFITKVLMNDVFWERVITGQN
jgi:signal transduction histidine kinase